MSFWQKLGLTTSNKEEKPKIKKEKESIIPSLQNTYTANTGIPVDTATYDNILDEAFNKVDLPGPDFREFYKTLKAIEKQPLPEQQKYVLAFTGLSIIGLTKDKIIQTSDIYLNAIEIERSEFQKGLDKYNKLEVEAKTNKSNSLAEENIKLQKQISENMSNISQLNIEIAQNSQNLIVKQQAFNSTIEREKSHILTILQNIKTYL